MRPAVKSETLRRLSLLEGQVRGLRVMVQDDRELDEILALLTAIDRAANAARVLCIADGLESQVRCALATPPAAELHYANIRTLLKKL